MVQFSGVTPRGHAVFPLGGLRRQDLHKAHISKVIRQGLQLDVAQSEDADRRREMMWANEEEIPMLGVHIHKDDKGATPTELSGYKVIEWSWPGIESFINKL